MDLSQIAQTLPMDDTTLIIAAIVAGVLLVGAAIALFVRRRRRRAELKDRFGPEYEHLVGRADGRRDAERELEDRERRRSELDLRGLEAPEQERFRARWDGVQRDFVDAPIAALQRADALLQEVQRSRGYPAGDFEQRVADLSVDHAHLVGSYRRLRALLDREEAPSLEAQRQALLEVRTLFDALLRPERDRDRELVPSLGHADGNGRSSSSQLTP